MQRLSVHNAYLARRALLSDSSTQTVPSVLISATIPVLYQSGAAFPWGSSSPG